MLYSLVVRLGCVVRVRTAEANRARVPVWLVRIPQAWIRDLSSRALQTTVRLD